jgi:UDP-N-acetylmuramoyl-tripeptide--D-alanyl-D-alanine ligase
LFLYLRADGKYALKVPAKKTGRYYRLFAVYYLFVISFCYLFISILNFLSVWNGSALYGLIAYVPFAITPILLPFLFLAANAVEGVFEKIRNGKFIKRAGQVLDETQIIRVGVVGSYGKTSVKNILKAILSQKYTVVETPESYNTPIGIAKTVFSPEFENKQVFIAEMGARKKGDIAQLCRLIKPDFAAFTGVCAQHIQTFGSEENVFDEKSEILKTGARVVCGESLKTRILQTFGEQERIVFCDRAIAKDVQFYATETEFILTLGNKNVRVKTPLLGEAALENTLIAATLAYQMGLTPEEIGVGLKSVKPIPHRLALSSFHGLYILDDGYNANEKGASEAIEALNRFKGRRCIVTPGIVECGVLEEKINETLGAKIAKAEIDTVILVGDTLVGAVKNGYLNAGGDKKKLFIVPSLDRAKPLLESAVGTGDCVLFLNDLPDVY